jgi:hypothetical protein
MRSIKWALASALVVVAAMPPVLALAQSNGAARDIAWPPAGVSATAGALAPPEIEAAARRAGFEPISRPLQRGRVYVLFALDPYDIDVRLTVDAGSGRVLRVAGMGGTRYGGAEYFYRPWSRYERPPAPPGDIPNMWPGRNNSGSVRSSASLRPALPLPRTRPADLTSAAAKETALPPQPAQQAREGREVGEPKTTAPVREVAPAAKALPMAPTMVPVAPLE